jgi:RNA recognition motif-containing protein
MENKLYVGNLPYSTTEADLQDTFSPYGTVTSATIITDRETGRSKGFGFVEMSTEEEALAAISGLDGTQMEGRTIKVNKSRPREDRPRGGGGGGRGRGGW